MKQIDIDSLRNNNKMDSEDVEALISFIIKFIKVFIAILLYA